MLRAKFDWSSGSGTEDFKISSNLMIEFSLFCNYLPFDKAMAVHLNNLESSFTQGALCQV